MGKEKNGSALLIAAKTNKHLLRGMAQCRVIHLKKKKQNSTGCPYCDFHKKKKKEQQEPSTEYRLLSICSMVTSKDLICSLEKQLKLILEFSLPSG